MLIFQIILVTENHFCYLLLSMIVKALRQLHAKGIIAALLNSGNSHDLGNQGHTGIPGLWTQELDAGLWTLDSGRWTLDAGLWTLNSGRCTLDAGRWELDDGRWTMDSGRWTMDSGRWTLDAGLWTLDSGLWTLDATLRKLGSGH